MQEATMDEMNQAMNNNRYAGDSKLHVEFYYKPLIQKTATEEAGRPVYEDVLYARVTPPGGQTVDQAVDDITRRRFADRIAKFEAMQKEGDQVEGFRLEEWPQITRSEVETLKYMRIYTVEQLADTPDGNLQGFMGAMMLKQKAAEFLEQTTGAEAQLKAMAERMAEMEAKLAAQEEAPAPKRRARRPKAEPEPDVDQMEA